MGSPSASIDNAWRDEWQRAGLDLDRGQRADDVRIAVVGPGVDAGHPSLAGRVYRDLRLPGAVIHPFVERPATHALTVAAGSATAAAAPQGPASGADLGIYRTSLTPDGYPAETALALADAVYDHAGIVFMTRGLEMGLGDLPEVERGNGARGGVRAEDILPGRLAAATGSTAHDWRVWLSAIRATQGSAVVVQPALNQPEWDEIDLIAGMPALLPELGRSWITAVGVDGDGALVTAPCGAAAAWCLAAPGSPVSGAVPRGWPMGTQIGDSRYESWGGGLIAAARVVAALALLEEELGLPPEAAARKILDTADAEFDGFDPQHHGNGLLDIAAALVPAAPLVVPVPEPPESPGPQESPTAQSPTGPALPTPSSPSKSTPASAPLAGTRIIPGPSFGDGFHAGLAPFRTVVIDRYGAIYELDLRSLVAEGAPVSIATLMDRHETRAGWRREARAVVAVSGSRGNLRLRGLMDAAGREGVMATFDAQRGAPASAAGANGGGEFGDGFRLTALGTGGFLHSDDPGRFHIFDSPLPDPVLGAPSADDPFAAMVEGASGIGMGLSFANGRSIEGWVYTGRGEYSRRRTDGLAFRVTDLRGDGADVVRGGLIAEDGAMLGTRMTGAMGRTGRSLTGYVSATGYRTYFDGLLDFSFGASAGTTLTSLSGPSLVLDLGPVRTASVATEAAVNGLLAPRDRLSLSFEAPLRAVSAPGRLVTRVRNDHASATQGGIEDRVAFFDARPTGWEARWGASYSAPLAPGASIGLSALYREHAGHRIDAAPEWEVRLRFAARL